MLAPILAAPLLFLSAPMAQDAGQDPDPIQELDGSYILNFAEAEDGEEVADVHPAARGARAEDAHAALPGVGALGRSCCQHPPESRQNIPPRAHPGLLKNQAPGRRR